MAGSSSSSTRRRTRPCRSAPSGSWCNAGSCTCSRMRRCSAMRAARRRRCAATTFSSAPIATGRMAAGISARPRRASRPTAARICTAMRSCCSRSRTCIARLRRPMRWRWPRRRSTKSARTWRRRAAGSGTGRERRGSRTARCAGRTRTCICWRRCWHGTRRPASSGGSPRRTGWWGCSWSGSTNPAPGRSASIFPRIGGRTRSTGTSSRPATISSGSGCCSATVRPAAVRRSPSRRRGCSHSRSGTATIPSTAASMTSATAPAHRC